MACLLRWLGHGGWEIRTQNHTLLLDPFLDSAPSPPCKGADLNADFILVSHGHFDHIADVPAIAQRTSACVIACYEITEWLQAKHGLTNFVAMNIGGKALLPFGEVKMVPAWHSSQLPDGSYGGSPAGFVLTLQGNRYYFACDTAVFSDMSMLSVPGLHVAVLPIGDLFTMGPEDSIEALTLLKPKHVLPAHYNTWPPIAQDAAIWAEHVRKQTASQPHLLQLGESIEL